MEIMKLIEQLPNKSSSGNDNISNTMIKELKDAIVTPLSILFNNSITSGIFPSRMKEADIVPLYKTKSKFESNNYRPISLLLTISKLLEKVIYKRTYGFFEEQNVLNNSQYGFRSKHSCEHAIAELLGEVVKHKYQGEFTVAIFLDLSKAFDTLEHSVLYSKLERYGIRGLALKWFQSYLHNRQMRIKCIIASTGQIEHSSYYTVEYGTPQGSCLGPFIIPYIQH